MASQLVRRALLYVPGSSSKFLDKSRQLAVDCVAYDLEDSVTPANKAAARHNVRDFLSQPRAPSIKEQAVRINAVDTGLALDDLTQVLKAPNLDAIVVPKVNSASDLHFVTDVLKHSLPASRLAPSNSNSTAPGVRIIALVESAKAIMNLPQICQASPFLSGLIFAAEDFALDLSITRTPSLSEFLYARSAIVTAARAHNLDSTIDLVCTSYKGPQGTAILEQECSAGKAMGFNGKQCIHPSQVDACHRVFSPSDNEVEWATRVVIADDKAKAQGRGAWTLDGKMIDAPVVGKANAIVRRAQLCGIHLEDMRQKWAHQEPE